MDLNFFGKTVGERKATNIDRTTNCIPGIPKNSLATLPHGLVTCIRAQPNHGVCGTVVMAGLILFISKLIRYRYSETAQSQTASSGYI